MEDDSLVAELRRRFPEGSIVRGVVKHHAPFGFFVDLGVPEADGLVRIVDVKDEPPVSPANDYPPVGSEVDAYVWGVSAGGRPQVDLSIKPSVLRGAV